MASAELRAIRRRIRSVESTKKITRAMELIAASRIVKARERVHASRPYADKMIEVIRNVARASGDASDPLLERRDLTTMGVLVVTSDRGLAGAYNSSVLRRAERFMVEQRARGVELRLFAVGKKAQTYFSFRGYEIAESFLAVTDQPTYADARRIATALMTEYRSGAVDAVDVFFTVYRSALSYVPTRTEVLPVTPPTSEEDEDEGTAGPEVAVSYEFEPDPGVILGRLLPRYVESAIYGHLLESSASEHASRQRAMKAATDNAEELIKVLTRTANQARQAEITTEIAEIVGGAQALSAS
ncbi:MAG: F0F1 ATP synthase subunit gamma [Acidimicrobiia bacterium]|nr:F0F1 ATP synthase subunit gamma [bacterium]MDE0643090.1 F0F1 ATP synthase subunit gamma [bacterium]MXZ06138.1 F0F1 ATP synthase subunit gamma [Acidimicrobiia bacterium]MYF26289.1 F0F1 ATP synthase subunit gamma [Acidimicrobiia bacterium]MYH55102.1 F0F1 ATP synthase subunit gamma [Acidimicrobiia bacterium]